MKRFPIILDQTKLIFSQQGARTGTKFLSAAFKSTTFTPIFPLFSSTTVIFAALGLKTKNNLTSQTAVCHTWLMCSRIQKKFLCSRVKTVVTCWGWRRSLQLTVTIMGKRIFQRNVCLILSSVVSVSLSNFHSFPSHTEHKIYSFRLGM